MGVTLVRTKGMVALYIVLAAVVSAGAALCLGGPLYVLWPILGIVALAALCFLPPGINRRLSMTAAVFSVLLTASIGMRYFLWPEQHPFSPWDIPAVICLLILFFITAVTALGRFHLLENRFWSRDKGKWKPWQIFLLGFFLMLLGWLPYYLRFYPGCSSYDSYNIMMQALGKIELGDWHPVLYTLVLRLFMSAGVAFNDYTAGNAAFTAFQMAGIAAGLSYAVCWLYRKGLRMFWIVITILLFAFVPMFGLLSITMWKDVPFSLLILLLSLQLYDIAQTRGEALLHIRGAVAFIAVGSGMALLRHNGLYILLATVGILAVMLRRRILRALPALAGSVALVLLIQGAYSLCGIAKSPFSESLSIPVQQIARTVVTGGTITDEQQQSLERFLDLEKPKTYEPYLADNAKNSLRQEYLNAHKGEFLKLWASLLPANFEEYVRAYGLQTYGYWYPLPPFSIVDYPRDGARELGIVYQNLLSGIPWLEDPGFIYYYLGIGVMVWICIFLITHMIYRRRKKPLLAFVPILGVWGTLMLATPVADTMRYILVLPLVLPFLIFLTARKFDGSQADGPPAEGTAAAEIICEEVE